jgi:hypothetical protein
MNVDELIEDHPTTPSFDRDRLSAAIKACFACEESCTACADACLGEDDVARMAECIRLDLVCADICGTAGRVLARQGTSREVTEHVLRACVAVCQRCAAECGAHAEHHAHCARCAEACSACADACAALLD